jgi:peptidyl-prolyl cis-trans isomerase B (cyclophilin B)
VTRAQERAAARRRWEKQQAAAARRSADRDRNKRVVAVVAVLAVVIVGFIVAAQAIKPGGTTAAGAKTTTTPTTATTNAAGCPMPPNKYGTGAELTLPDKKPFEGKTYIATMTTNCGDVTLQLDGTKAPQAVASFVQLAQKGYWINSPCHRLTTSGIYVLQCGDPTGSGQGTPGYGFAVENAPKDQTYPRGTVAMARTSDPVKGNGGQFFLVYKDTQLPDKNGYTIFGTITGGMDIVDKIAKAGVGQAADNPSDGVPAAPISILRVTVTEKKA